MIFQAFSIVFTSSIDSHLTFPDFYQTRVFASIIKATEPSPKIVAPLIILLMLIYLPKDLITISICPMRLSTTSPACLSPLLTMTTVIFSCSSCSPGTSRSSLRRMSGITFPRRCITSFACTYYISLTGISSIV